MPRIARMKVKGEPAVYHVISRTTLDGFVLGDVEKDHLVSLIRHLSAIYFAEVLGNNEIDRVVNVRQSVAGADIYGNVAVMTERFDVPAGRGDVFRLAVKALDDIAVVGPECCGQLAVSATDMDYQAAFDAGSIQDLSGLLRVCKA